MQAQKIWKFFLCLALLSSASVTAQADTSNGLPALSTNLAKKYLLGVAERGEVLEIRKIEQLPSGEIFVYVYNPYSRENYGWVQVDRNQKNLLIGKTIVLDSPRYRFSQPIVEELDLDVFESDIEYGYDELIDLGAYKLNTTKFGMASSCNNFIQANGKLGPWGEHIKKVLSPKTHPLLFSNQIQDIKICPKFAKMSVEQKKEFWIWFLAAMANHESTCRPAVKVKAVNGTAAGLLQLHYGHEHKYGCKKGIKSTTAKDNLTCGLTMLNNDIGRTKNWFPRKDNYWDVLRWPRPAAKKTLNIVKAYGPCR
ncbi:MAG: hypothetical protein M9962_08865 [Oligoflexia bacterium]|nr:hypothetical protein [Oligoflexia bacterium]